MGNISSYFVYYKPWNWKSPERAGKGNHVETMNMSTGSKGNP